MLQEKLFNLRYIRASLYKIGALLLVVFSFSYLSFRLALVSLPSAFTPLVFYSNQKGDDLKRLLLTALSQTKDSLFLQIYGCTDPAILSTLQFMIKKNIRVQVFYDPSGSGHLYKKIEGAVPLHRNGLMHKKILILDEKLVLIGSANFTPTSLCMHDNIIVGLYSQELAYDLKHSISNHLSYFIGGQKVEFWHLPDHRYECLYTILSMISHAKKHIRMALFTFTHPKILEALKAAKQRGVHVEVALDYSTAHGASQPTVDFLQKASISPLISAKNKLLHHKWCLIDEQTLLLGSANWTKSAFMINEDCLLIIHELTDVQKRQFEKIWKKITSASYKVK